MLIGHGVVLATINHGFPPDERGDNYPAPIVIGNKVRIGSHATILPGVTIGDGAIIAAEAVEYCRQHSIMNGISDTAFAPEDTLTHAMLATVLHRMSEKSEIIGGYGNGVFGVNDPTTQEQAVTIL